MQDIVLENNHSFDINQCGQVTGISEQAIILTPLYYFPLVILIALVVTKLAMKTNFRSICKIRLV